MSLSQRDQQWLKEYEDKSDVELALLAVYTGPNSDSPSRAAIAKYVLDSRAAKIRDGREERTLQQAEKALKIAEEAKNATVKQAHWAIWATVISVVAAIVAVAGLFK